MELIAIEMIETVVPIAYVTTFAIAFYGENADIIGGVKFSGWQHNEVEDIGRFATDLIKMIAIDFIALIVSGNLLWRFATINILSDGYRLMKVYWPFIAIRIGGITFLVNFEF